MLLQKLLSSESFLFLVHTKFGLCFHSYFDSKSLVISLRQVLGTKMYVNGHFWFPSDMKFCA